MDCIMYPGACPGACPGAPRKAAPTRRRRREDEDDSDDECVPETPPPPTTTAHRVVPLALNLDDEVFPRGRRVREDDDEEEEEEEEMPPKRPRRGRRVREDDDDDEEEEEMPPKHPRRGRRVREDDDDEEEEEEEDSSDDEWIMHDSLQVGAALPRTLPADTSVIVLPDSPSPARPASESGSDAGQSDAGQSSDAPTTDTQSPDELTDQDKLWQSVALTILYNTKPGPEQEAMLEMVRRIRTLAPPATGLVKTPQGIVIPACSAETPLPLGCPVDPTQAPITIHFARRQDKVTDLPFDTTPTAANACFARVVVASSKLLATWNKRTGKFTTRKFKTLDKLARAALGPHHRRPHVPHTN